MKRWLSVTMALFAVIFIVVYMIAEVAEGDKRGAPSVTKQKLVKTETMKTGDIRIATVTTSGNQVHTLKDLAARSPNFNVEWFSANSGGDIAAFSANFASGVSVAQAAAGEATSTNFQLDVGFWNGIGTCCQLPGDADDGGDVNIGDATFIVKYVFQGGATPPCCDQADADGGGDVNIGDATFIVKFVFQGGTAPECPSPGNLICL